LKLAARAAPCDIVVLWMKSTGFIATNYVVHNAAR